MAHQPADVPLLCLICPNGPKFCDLSHLLTHISSKAHLSNTFKLQVRANTEAEAQNSLERYRHWHDTFHIGRMLEERHRKKDKRISRSRPKKTPKPTRAKVTIKSEDDIASDDLKQLLESHNLEHSYPSPVKSNRSHLIYDDARRTRMTPFSDNTSYTDGRQQPGIETTEDGTPLRGQVWPGMGLFDSASPDVKRTRNQKKDDTTLARLINDSSNVEPIEVVFEKDLKTMRSSESMYSDAVDPSLKPPKKTRKVLSKIDSNVQLKSRGQKRACKGSDDAYPDEDTAAPGKPQQLYGNVPRYDYHSTYPTSLLPPVISQLPPGFFVVGPDQRTYTYSYPYLHPNGSGPSILINKETTTAYDYPAHRPEVMYAPRYERYPYGRPTFEHDHAMFRPPTSTNPRNLHFYHSSPHFDTMPSPRFDTRLSPRFETSPALSYGMRPQELRGSDLLLTSPVLGRDQKEN